MSDKYMIVMIFTKKCNISMILLDVLMPVPHFKNLISCTSKSLRNLVLHSFHIRTFKTQNHNLSHEDCKILQCLTNQHFHQVQNLLDKMPTRPHNDGQLQRIVTCTSLLSKFSKNGYIDEAKSLFELMPGRNIVTYNAMLSGYMRNGRLSEARKLFEDMPERNVVSWTCMLCGLADVGMIGEAMRLFSVMPEKNVVSWNSMIGGLVKNGELDEARRVFESMQYKNQISWNVMISGYCENGEMEEARALFDQMRDKNVITWTSLIAGYCRNCNVEEGYALFQKLPVADRNVVSWTAMIGGFSWNGFYNEALLLFLDMMRTSECKPNEETLISLAYACAGAGFPDPGKQIHAHLIVNGNNDYDGRLSKSLIHMYSVFGAMDSAHSVYLQNWSTCSVQSYNSMIHGYIKIGHVEMAENLFREIPVRDKISWTSMINGFFTIGLVTKACKLFGEMPGKDAIAWTSMISGHVQNELFTEATLFFLEMRTHGFQPLASSYSILIGAAGAVADIDQGKQLHCLVLKTQSGTDLILENSLISMYAKCGQIDDAYSVFSNMSFTDLISWNTILMGFSHHGLVNEALGVFKLMLEAGFQPNSVTFLGVLSACNHAGLVHLGNEYFKSMSDKYAIQPGLEHYICMINLLGRAGKIEEAEEFVLNVLFNPNHAQALWGALLGVCGLYKTNTSVAKRAARKLLELDPLNAPGHVAMCNVFAANSLHVEECALRKEMGMKGVKKVPGCSWILLRGRFHMFLCGDKSNSKALELLTSLHGTIGKRSTICLSGI